MDEHSTSQETGGGAPEPPNNADEIRDFRTYPKADEDDDVAGHIYIEKQDSDGKTVRDQ